ncbi:hypothetical protein BOX15_Mlig029947g1, partial [Macrostomum lignano]
MSSKDKDRKGGSGGSTKDSKKGGKLSHLFRGGTPKPDAIEDQRPPASDHVDAPAPPSASANASSNSKVEFSKEELEQGVSEMVKDLNLDAKSFLNKDKGALAIMLQNYREYKQSKGDSGPYAGIVKKLSKPDSLSLEELEKNVSQLRVMLGTLTITDIKGFAECSGLQTLMAVLESCIKGIVHSSEAGKLPTYDGKTSPASPWYKVCYNTLLCVRKFCDNSFGMTHLLRHPKVVSTIVESLNIVPFLAPNEYAVGSCIFEIMSSFLFYYKSKTQELERNKVENVNTIVLRAFSTSRNLQADSSNRFFPIKNTLDKTCSLLNRPELGDELRVKVYELTRDCLLFINTLIDSCDDVDHRMAVRTELWSLVLKDRWKVLESTLSKAPDGSCRTQFDIFQDKGDQDASEISERFDGCLSNTEMNDPRFCFDLLWRSLEGTEADWFFKSILQHLLYVPFNNYQKDYFKLFEELISQLVLTKDGTYPDFRSRDLRTFFDFDAIKREMVTMEEQERERLQAKLQEKIKLEECDREATLQALRDKAANLEAQLEEARSRLREIQAGAAATGTGATGTAVPPPPPGPPPPRLVALRLRHHRLRRL